MADHPSVNLSVCILEAMQAWSNVFYGGVTPNAVAIEGVAIVAAGICVIGDPASEQPARVAHMQQIFAKSVAVLSKTEQPVYCQSAKWRRAVMRKPDRRRGGRKQEAPKHGRNSNETHNDCRCRSDMLRGRS
jgi:hypothetical protein